jgi:hypothetical protein
MVDYTLPLTEYRRETVVALKKRKPMENRAKDMNNSFRRRRGAAPRKKERVSIVRTSDFTTGIEIGRGGFCSVLEVQDCRVPLRRLPKRYPQETTNAAGSSTNNDKPKSKLGLFHSCLKQENSATKKNNRSAPFEHDVESKPNDDTYVVKLLRKNLTKRALNRGRLDLCIEAAHLLSIKHKHIVRGRDRVFYLLSWSAKNLRSKIGFGNGLRKTEMRNRVNYRGDLDL